MWFMPSARSRWPARPPCYACCKGGIVPLYEYVCRKCSKQFEALIFGAEVPTCPACQSTDLERLLSVVAVGSGQPAREPSACDSCCGRGGPGCGMN